MKPGAHQKMNSRGTSLSANFRTHQHQLRRTSHRSLLTDLHRQRHWFTMSAESPAKDLDAVTQRINSMMNKTDTANGDSPADKPEEKNEKEGSELASSQNLVAQQEAHESLSLCHRFRSQRIQLRSQSHACGSASGSKFAAL